MRGVFCWCIGFWMLCASFSWVRACLIGLRVEWQIVVSARMLLIWRLRLWLLTLAAELCAQPVGVCGRVPLLGRAFCVPAHAARRAWLALWGCVACSAG